MSAVTLAAVVLTALATLGLLLADAITGHRDAARHLDDDDAPTTDRDRARELTWTVAVTALIAVAVACGIDLAIRAATRLDDVASGVLVLALVAVAIFGVGLVAAFSAVRRERPAYARIRRDLRDRATLALEPDELDAFEDRLARADRMRSRSWNAPSVLRVIGVVVIAAAAAVVIADALPREAAATIVAACAAVILGATAAALGARAHRIRTRAKDAARDHQRAEVVTLLERARIPQRQSVPGLRDRVSRALAILREQQK